MPRRKTSYLSLLHIAGVKPYIPKNNDKYMNDDQLIHFRRILEAWKKKILNDLNLSKYITEKINNFPDPIDRAVQEEEFNFQLRNRERELLLIKKIEITLNKVNNKTFGFCDTCGVEIGLRRLEAQPIAHLCIDCKTIAEIREKQINGNG